MGFCSVSPAVFGLANQSIQSILGIRRNDILYKRIKKEININEFTRNPDESSKVMANINETGKSTESSPQSSEADKKSNKLYPVLPEDEDQSDDLDDDFDNIKDDSPQAMRTCSERKKQAKITPSKFTRKVLEPSCGYGRPQDLNSNRIIGFNLIFCFILIVLAAAVIYMIFFSSRVSHDSTNALTTKEIIASLKDSFPQQLDLSLRIISASIKKVLNNTSSGPTQPAVILLLSAKSSQEIANCFATKLSELISQSHSDYAVIDGLELQGKKVGEAKKSIENQIVAAHSSNKIVVLIKDLSKVSSEASLILTSYFDHENAPYKKMVYIIPIIIEESIPKSADSRTFDRLAHNHLEETWHNLDKDNLSALITRITVSVAGIFSENVSKSNCKVL